jgi:hypothetical protein
MNIIEYLVRLLTYHLLLIKEILFLIKRLSYFLLEMIHLLLRCHISKIEKLVGINHAWEYLVMELILLLKIIVIKIVKVRPTMEIIVVLLKS